MDRLDALVSAETQPAHTAYLVAVASSDYASAFAQVMSDPLRASLEMSPAERAALVAVRKAERFLALTMDTSTGGLGGGFALPFEIDPTIVLAGILQPVPVACLHPAVHEPGPGTRSRGNGVSRRGRRSE